MKKYFSITILFVITISFAQVETSNNNLWLHYVGKNTFAKKTSFTLEATMRYTDWGNEKQQWFIRPSIDYQFTNKFTGSIGYTHYETYSYGDKPINKITTPEDHVWLQGVYKYKCNNFSFTHRLRNEFRFVGVAKPNSSGGFEITDRVFRDRVRYMFLLNYTLSQTEDQIKWFAVMGDEVFLNIGTNAGKTFFNQNRIIAGVGYNFNKHHQIQLNYIQQHIWNFSNSIQEENPTIRVSYITNFDFTKK